jgi:hypothetical protein
MSEPKRYWMDDQNDADFPYEAVDGEWVKYEDYSRLKAEVEELKALTVEMDSTINVSQAACREYKAEVERLTEAGDAMADVCGWHCSDQSAADALVAKWNAAKEGKGQP